MMIVVKYGAFISIPFKHIKTYKTVNMAYGKTESTFNRLTAAATSTSKA